MNLAALRASLIAHEGLRLRPYQDTAGKWTIGVGRNLTDRGINEAEAMRMLERDLVEASAASSLAWPWWVQLDECRQRVFVELVFNMGLGGVRTFVQMLAAMERGDFGAAATELLDSRWAAQVGVNRAQTLAHMLATGRDV